LEVNLNLKSENWKEQKREIEMEMKKEIKIETHVWAGFPSLWPAHPTYLAQLVILAHAGLVCAPALMWR
jgi:hypothetical protein